MTAVAACCCTATAQLLSEVHVVWVSVVSLTVGATTALSPRAWPASFLCSFCRAATWPWRTIDGHAQPVRLRGQSQETIARDHNDCGQMAARANGRCPRPGPLSS